MTWYARKNKIALKCDGCGRFLSWRPCPLDGYVEGSTVTSFLGFLGSPPGPGYETELHLCKDCEGSKEAWSSVIVEEEEDVVY